MSILSNIKQELLSKGINPNSRSAVNWLISKIESMSKSDIRSDLLRDNLNLEPRMRIGRMYFFRYDPKLKDTLPYYDTFPLIFPIERYSDGFLGLNLHYLSSGRRAELLVALQTLRNNNRYDESTRLKISYDLINRMSRFDDARICIKRYLNGHLRSRFVEIPSDEWNLAIYLPVESFVNGKTKKSIKRPGRIR